MGKRRRSVEESEDERREKKRRKKEAKKKHHRKSKERRNENEEDESTVTAIADDSTVFFKKKLEMTVSLLPAALRDVPRSVEDSLRGLVLRYSNGLDGVLLTYENVRILKEGKGMILNELPYIHYTVACDALVFRPIQGSVLEGVVTKSFPSHLSLVVHQYFNASISSDQLQAAGFDFDEKTEQWQHSSVKANNDAVAESCLSKNKKVQFKVDRVLESGGIISLVGSEPALL